MPCKAASSYTDFDSKVEGLDIIWVKYKTGVFMYKAYNTLLPSDIQNNFSI